MKFIGPKTLEGAPVELLPCDMGRLIDSSEMVIRWGMHGKSMKRIPASMEEDAQSVKPVFDASRAARPLAPRPRTDRLQQRIHPHLLPQKTHCARPLESPYR
jgi:hypothetical protein